MKKRTLSLIIAILMLVCALPFAASGAAPTLEKDADGYYLVNTYDEFCDYLIYYQGAAGYMKFRLAADIAQNDSLNDRVLLLNSCHAQLDLNGHTLSRICKSTDRALIDVINYSSLTVVDSSYDGSGLLEFSNSAISSAYVIRATSSNVKIESGNYTLRSKGSILKAEGSELVIIDGVFDDASGDSYGIEATRTVVTSTAPSVYVYNAVFHTSRGVVHVYQEPAGKFTESFPNTPVVAIFDGEFYTDNDCGVSYVSNGIGKCFIYGGLVPKQFLNPKYDRVFPDGTKQSAEKVDGKDYIRVYSPMWLFNEKIGLERLSDAVLRDYLNIIKEKNAAEYVKYKSDIDPFLSLPAWGKVGELDLNPLQFNVSVTRKDVKTMRLYASSNVDTATWKDGPWSLVDTRTPSPGDYILTVARPQEKTSRVYRLEVEYSDGSTWNDYVEVDFAAPRPTMSGTPFPTMNAVSYGNTLICGIVDYPSEIPIESLCYEWFVDGKSVGTGNKIKLDDPSWVGKKLTVRVTSTVAEGSIVSAPVKIAKARNDASPMLPNVKVVMNGDSFSKIELNNASLEQVFIFSKKAANALTDDDWTKAFRPNTASLSFNNTALSDLFGFTVSTGDTVYLHTRYPETNTTEAGSVVSTVALKISDTVYLQHITFPDAVNNTIYIPFTGADATFDIAYDLDPVNATDGNNIRWRSSSSSLTIVSPTSPEPVAAASGKITLKATSVGGGGSIEAYYTTLGETTYGRVNVIVYDPSNVTASILRLSKPLEDVTVFAGTGFWCEDPEFIVEPTVPVDIKWYFTVGTMYGWERKTDMGFATIDPDTGEIEANAPGKVTVSMFVDDRLFDSYQLTVIEMPEGYAALEELIPGYSEITLKEGETRALNILPSPANAAIVKLLYESSQPSVASVDESGLVTAQTKGETFITVTEKATNVTAVIKVTVVDSVIPSVMPGDVNGDGKLNAKDVTAIMKHLIGKTPANFIEEAADYNGDGKINAKDVTQMMKYLVTHP